MQLSGNFKPAPYGQQSTMWGAGSRDEESNMIIEIVFSSETEARAYVQKVKQDIRDNGYRCDPPVAFPVVAA